MSLISATDLGRELVSAFPSEEHSSVGAALGNVSALPELHGRVLATTRAVGPGGTAAAMLRDVIEVFGRR